MSCYEKVLSRFTVSTFIGFLSKECLVTHHNDNTNIHIMQAVHSTDVIKKHTSVGKPFF